MEMKDVLKKLREKNSLTQEQMAKRSDGYQTGCQSLGNRRDTT